MVECNLAKVLIKKGGTTLATFNKSTSAPTVSGMTITTGSAAPGVSQASSNTLNVCWSITDPDGDALTYTLQYSADGGATWTIVVLDITDSCYTVDLSTLEASSAGKFRVIASDGFNQTVYESTETITVSDAGPSVYLNHEEQIAMLREGDQFLLSAWAYDKEDGNLASTSVVWKDQAGTTLGSGEAQVTYNGSDATYTVTATDSAGNPASKSVALVQDVVSEASVPALGFNAMVILACLLMAVAFLRAREERNH